MKTKSLLRKACLLLALVEGVNSAWADDATATIDFGSEGYGSLVGISFSDGTKTEGSLVDATLGDNSTKVYSSVYSAKALSTSFTSKNSYNNIGQISFYVSTTDKGKTYLAVEVSSKSDFSSDVTTVQASAVMNGGGLPTNVGSNNVYYQETYTLATRVSGYVRITVSEASGSSGKTINIGKIDISYIASSEAYTVTFNAGSNGSCATSSLTEASAGAGVTLPAVTANSNYTFNGWFTASSGGTKVGNAGATYNPTANTTLYAQYSANSAPTIAIDNYNPSTNRGKAVTFTATPTGAPAPTVTWYQSETATTTGGTEKGTGATYQPDVTAEGTFYYYAVASNGIGSDATSDLITLTVNNPDVDRTGFNTYYVAKNETAVGGEQVLCDDITMVYDDVTYNTAGDDKMINALNANYVASIGSSINGWGVTFTPSKSGILNVGVVINSGKTFSITNVTEFSYMNPNGSGTVESNTWTPSEKQYAIISITVEADKNYKFSVASSKMAFYGFEFASSVTGTFPSSGVATLASSFALDLSGVEAYVISEVNGGSAKCTQITEAPANTGIILVGEAGAAYNIPVKTSAAAPASNLLVGVVADTEIAQGSYILQGGQFHEIENASVLAAGKAYLPANVNGARAISLSFGEVTGINKAAAEVKAATVGKFIKKGQLVIGKNGKEFNANGAQVK